MPKRTKKRPEWLSAACVNEICSVSTCVSDAPDGWIEQGRYNEMFVYDTPELAWSIVSKRARPEFDLYAYKVFPFIFTEGNRHSFEVPPVHVQSLPPSFIRLGYDVVSRSCDADFECSPLSCNHMAEEVVVNQFCLVDDLDAAFRLAMEFDTGHCEPGPYLVVEVWRQKHDAA